MPKTAEIKIDVEKTLDGDQIVLKNFTSNWIGYTAIATVVLVHKDGNIEKVLPVMIYPKPFKDIVVMSPDDFASFSESQDVVFAPMPPTNTISIYVTQDVIDFLKKPKSPKVTVTFKSVDNTPVNVTAGNGGVLKMDSANTMGKKKPEPDIEDVAVVQESDITKFGYVDVDNFDEVDEIDDDVDDEDDTDHEASVIPGSFEITNNNIDDPEEAVIADDFVINDELQDAVDNSGLRIADTEEESSDDSGTEDFEPEPAYEDVVNQKLPPPEAPRNTSNKLSRGRITSVPLTAAKATKKDDPERDMEKLLASVDEMDRGDLASLFKKLGLPTGFIDRSSDMSRVRQAAKTKLETHFSQ